MKEARHTRGQRQYDSTHTKYLEQANSQRQRIDQGLGRGEDAELLFNGYRESLGLLTSFGDRW